jgi:GntR family transcriptional regulator
MQDNREVIKTEQPNYLPISSFDSYSVDSKNHISLHLQIREILRKVILQEDIKPNAQIPPEEELAKCFNVSRVAMRQAIMALVNEGLLYRKQGKGTFVGWRKVRGDLDRLHSLAEELKLDGVSETSAITLSVGFVKPNDEISAIFDLNHNEKIFYYERLRIAGGDSIAYEQGYWAEPIGSRLIQEDLNKVVIYDFIESNLGITLDFAYQTIEALIADKKLSKLLNVPSNTALLKMEKLTRTEVGKAIEFSTTYYRGDRYKYTVQLSR